ncbi:hypothetical protein NHX12_014822 [Muraenolepis orangiensis]|uniref:Uncharacterized protein n=1 Tax=Muraenolepis orangiensis TaxID=630683 RepID=A0A9Q0DAU2_9TELE|nr:hypothetical protein NHX12_014822 [Muraenolepis orangiensis]
MPGNTGNSRGQCEALCPLRHSVPILAVGRVTEALGPIGGPREDSAHEYGMTKNDEKRSKENQRIRQDSLEPFCDP